MPDLPNIDADCFHPTNPDHLFPATRSTHPPRILLLYGSLRDRSFSRFAAEEAARILTAFGAETRIFDPRGLPLVDENSTDDPKVTELRDLVTWCEGMVWSSPER
ncbi:MAG: NADPH-dependent FMN reductase, partial [Sphingomonadaceae bacterium]